MRKYAEIRRDVRNKLPSWRKHLIGNGNGNGLVFKIAIYFLSITFAFVFVYPLFYMFMISLMSNTDLVDSTILWVPSGIYYRNYLFAFNGLELDKSYYKTVINVLLHKDIIEASVTPYLVELRKLILIVGIIPFTVFFGGLYTENKRKLFYLSTFIVIVIMFLPKSYVDSVYVAGSVTLVTVISSAIVGYGLARFKFKGKGLIMLIMLLVYVLPKTLLFMPRSMLYNTIGIKGTMFALWIPSFFGQGLQATFFILIFYQFFKMMPAQIEESAYIDGANTVSIFFRIALPMAVPAFVISLTYGFAVNWNEMFLTNIYLDGHIRTIPMLLQGLQAAWGNAADYSVNSDFVNVDFTEAKAFAGTMLSIMPLVIMYGIIQRYFIESIDKSGITGE
jgi:multiple sugar transport system permease protein